MKPRIVTITFEVETSAPVKLLRAAKLYVAGKHVPATEKPRVNVIRRTKR